MSEQQAALQFPCQFPIKAVSKCSPNIDIKIVEIIRRHSPDLHQNAVKTRPSKGGKYISVTVTIQATSQQQLDCIYQDLSLCSEVIIAL